MAHYWLQKASECPVPEQPLTLPLRQRAIGVSSALNILGLWHQNGIVVGMNGALAVDCWKKAASLQNGGAFNNLGLCHLNGTNGQDLDVRKALDYFRKAAKLGDVPAMVNLVDVYKRSQDYALALQWAGTARDNGWQGLDAQIHMLRELVSSGRPSGVTAHNIGEVSGEQRYPIGTMVGLEDAEQLMASGESAAMGEAPRVSLRDALGAIPESLAKHIRSFRQPTLGTENAGQKDLADLEKQLQAFPGPFFARLVALRRRLEDMVQRYGKDISRVMMDIDQIFRALAELVRKEDSHMVLQHHFVQIAVAVAQEIRYDVRDVDVVRASLTDSLDISKNVAKFEALVARYPDDDHFEYILSVFLAWEGPSCDRQRSLSIALRLLARHHSRLDSDPKKMHLLYHLGVLHHQLCEGKPEDEVHHLRSVEFLKRFLAVAEADMHRKVPQAFYLLGVAEMLSSISSKDDPTAGLLWRKYLIQGKVMDEKLPEFLRCGITAQRSTLETAASIPVGESASHASSSSGESASHGSSSSGRFRRVSQDESLILHNLRLQHSAQAQAAKSMMHKLHTTMTPPLKSYRRPEDHLSKIEDISLEELLGPQKDHVFFGRSLLCVVVNVPTLGPSLQCNVEDKYRYPALFAVYNYDKKLRRKMVPGTVLRVINPYARVSMSGEPMIRVDNPEETIHFEKSTLRFCWGCLREPDPGRGQLRQCSRCNKAEYCSEGCQRKDWVEFGHKYQCSSLSSS